jgi:hypothetical protein
VSTDKTLLPSIFFIESFLAAKIFSTGRIRSLHFVRMIPGRFPSAAIRSATLRLLRLLLQTAVVASALQASCCAYRTEGEAENFDVLLRLVPPF